MPEAAMTGGVVLLVEDNAPLREDLEEILVGEGYRCWVAATADRALSVLEEHAPDVPQLLLLDLRMPGMRVEDFLARVKERPAWATLPIVLTTAALKQEIPADLPVDSVLLKPFDIDALLALAREMTGRH